MRPPQVPIRNTKPIRPRKVPRAGFAAVQDDQTDVPDWNRSPLNTKFCLDPEMFSHA